MINNSSNRKALIRGVKLENYPIIESKFNRIYLFRFAPTLLEDPLGDFLMHEYKGDALWEVRLEFFSAFEIRKLPPKWDFKYFYRGFNHREAQRIFNFLVKEEKVKNPFINLLGDQIRLIKEKPIGGLHRWKEYKIEKIDPDGFASLLLLNGGGEMLSKETYVDEFLGKGYAEIAKLAFDSPAIMGGSIAQPRQGDVVLGKGRVHQSHVTNVEHRVSEGLQ